MADDKPVVPRDSRYMLHITQTGFSCHGGGQMYEFEDDQVTINLEESIIQAKSDESYRYAPVLFEEHYYCVINQQLFQTDKKGENLRIIVNKTPPHHLNSIFPLDNRLLFFSQGEQEIYELRESQVAISKAKEELVEVESQHASQFELVKTQDFAETLRFLLNQEFGAETVVSWFAGTVYFYIISQINTQIHSIKESNCDYRLFEVDSRLLFNFQNLAIFEDFRLLDVSNLQFYKNVKRFGLEIAEKLIPREEGWIIDYDYLEERYEEGVIDAEMRCVELLDSYYLSLNEANQKREKVGQ